MVTIRDVAQTAGVSYQTVSRVLNAPDTVSPLTRTRVEAAIRTMGYHPNAAARRLKLGHGQLFGVATTDLLGYGPTRTVQAFMDAAEADGRTVLITRFDPAHNWDAVQSGTSTSLDALFEYDVQLVALVGGTLSLARALNRIAPALPVLNIGVPLPGFLSVGVDQRRAIAELVDHLVELGHRHIAHLAGPANSLDATEREHGWRSATRAHGLPKAPLIRADWTATSAFEAVRQLRLLDFTALVSADDRMALGAIRAIRDHGLTIPRDISLVGFNGTDDAANYQPALTTAHQPFELVGKRAYDIASQLLRQDGSPQTTLLPAAVRVRDSTTGTRQ